MKSTIVPIAALTLLLTAVATPAAAQNREHQQMAAELRMLQEQTQKLQLAMAQTLQQLAEAVKKIEARLDAADATQRKALADQKLGIDGMSTEMRMIRQGTQDVNTRIGTLTEEVEAIRTSLPSLAARTPDPGFGGLPGDAPQLSAAPARALGISPNRLFQTAMADYTSGSYSLAITGFQEFLSMFPKSEQADDAQYYIGNSYAAQKKYQEAVTAFNVVIQNYSTGDKVPEAYVDLGQAQRALGQTEAARASWQAVLQKYPTSTSATIAKQRLDGLPQAPRLP